MTQAIEVPAESKDSCMKKRRTTFKVEKKSFSADALLLHAGVMAETTVKTPVPDQKDEVMKDIIPSVDSDRTTPVAVVQDVSNSAPADINDIEMTDYKFGENVVFCKFSWISLIFRSSSAVSTSN